MRMRIPSNYIYIYTSTLDTAVCLRDNIGLVVLILLGWELRASYITVLCVQAVMILFPSLSHSNFYITCIHSTIVYNMLQGFRKGVRRSDRIYAHEQWAAREILYAANWGDKHCS